ncbi:cytochrome c biogenesis heme-transporting ATPase CcmA [Balneatrix alpica]|uniref:Cytochrome c biogenesis heme-transporting ATPase CcmA n=1 Tax=Balneatrix alpica TaxID=75684 RepID=A0ABV5ZE32_9GAMM|nr:cytochrome c biogenesis heme-transporting ATPase CcmA [Balneatrix alpica]
MTAILLQAKQLGMERDDRLLFRQLSFSLAAGEVLQVEGPNGAGKTTLLKCIGRLLRLSAGELYWQGQPLAEVQAEYFSQMLYCGHGTGIKAALTPLENLRWLAGLQPHLQAEQARQALSQVGLARYEDVPCYQLSAGQQRRVNLARLYMTTAPLWVLDEPFTAIDRKGVQALEQHLQAKAAAGGSVIFTTHHELSADFSCRRLSLDGKGGAQLD